MVTHSRDALLVDHTFLVRGADQERFSDVVGGKIGEVGGWVGGGKWCCDASVVETPIKITRQVRER